MRGSPPSVDVLIVGSGPAGSTLALACAKRGMRVTILARTPRGRSKPPVETLPPRGEFLLRSLGVASDCLEGAIRSDETLVSWEGSSLACNRFTLNPHGSNWRIDRESFDNALANAVQALGVERIFVPSFSRLEIGRVGKEWSVQTGRLQTGLSIRSDLLVDCSGLARVLVRSLGGMAMRDDLLAIAWTVVEDCKGHSALLIEACPEGWWYSLGQPDGTLLCALVLDARYQIQSGEARIIAWQRAWEQSRYSRERVPYWPTKLSISIAESGRLDRLHGDGWFVIGDAATSFDPLSSNGLSSAIEQSIALTQVITGGATLVDRSQYANSVIDNFERYRTQRRELYKSVKRFSHHNFWLSRFQ